MNEPCAPRGTVEVYDNCFMPAKLHIFGVPAMVYSTKMLSIFAFLLSKCVIFGRNLQKNCNFATVKTKKIAILQQNIRGVSTGFLSLFKGSGIARLHSYL